ncbi:hypothetical protein [Laspinema sp. D2d]|uniref:hypothetical protein n=1 Tax=Laspinema sp. D2d TaxID=2953686 RepID=UPI0021BA6161|nr:hypothetical protein [Laspinema sp. D2d]
MEIRVRSGLITEESEIAPDSGWRSPFGSFQGRRGNTHSAPIQGIIPGYSIPMPAAVS